MRRQWRRFVDWLLGPRCSCDERVFPVDRARHELEVHGVRAHGRCGALLPLPTPHEQFVTSTSCGLSHGHLGWHRADSGAEWSR